MKKMNSTGVYVLSIISFFCCCFLGFGTFLAGPAFFMANNKLKDSDANPEKYDPDSVNAMKGAKTVALIALVINGLYLLYSIYSLATTDWEVFWEQYQKALEQYQ